MKNLRIMKITRNNGNSFYRLQYRITLLCLPTPFWNDVPIDYNTRSDYKSVKEEYDRRIGNQVKSFEVIE
ncbi:hypothetical protein [Lactococcus ileimucosae]|uniref:hypothetical protein n=1 Tax=Lactococcus ileimucosae TaxID=2941329 RepID=UPI003518D2EF